MSIADDVKTLLSGSLDDKLKVIQERTEKRLQSKLGTNEVPSELDYIVYEVSLKRFNRIGQEGMQSYSQEGEAITFPDSDFAEFEDEILEFKRKENEIYKPKTGRFQFY